jgi:hypothetical protein
MWVSLIADLFQVHACFHLSVRMLCEESPEGKRSATFTSAISDSLRVCFRVDRILEAGDEFADDQLALSGLAEMLLGGLVSARLQLAQLGQEAILGKIVAITARNIQDLVKQEFYIGEGRFTAAQGRYTLTDLLEAILVFLGKMYHKFVLSAGEWAWYLCKNDTAPAGLLLFLR